VMFVFINCHGFFHITFFVFWEISQITESVVLDIFNLVLFFFC